MFLIFLLYLSVFFTLGLLVSARTSKSSTSFLVLLFIWVTFVTVIPKLSVMLAAQLNPIPSVHEITAKKDAFLQQIQGGAQKKVMDWMKENAPKEGEDQKVYQDKFKKFLEDFQQESTSKIDENNAALERDYQAKKSSQQNLAINLSRISPASALTFSTMSLARTGIDEHERFLASIRTYKPIFTKWANSRMMQNINFRDGGAGKSRPRRYAPAPVRSRGVGQIAGPRLPRFRADALPDHRLFRRGLCLVPEIRRALRGDR